MPQIERRHDVTKSTRTCDERSSLSWFLVGGGGGDRGNRGNSGGGGNAGGGEYFGDEEPF